MSHLRDSTAASPAMHGDNALAARCEYPIFPASPPVQTCPIEYFHTLAEVSQTWVNGTPQPTLSGGSTPLLITVRAESSILNWTASIRHLMKRSATSSGKFGQKLSHHVMPKVLVLF